MASEQKGAVLSARAQQLFRLLVERYISDGQPVGSRTLARGGALDLSPATIRNVMADLEDMGLIRAPHTSAGRVPTTRGFRLFVSSLLQCRQLSAGEVDRVCQGLSTPEGVPRLLEKTSTLLSEISRYAAVVMAPRTEHRSFRHIEFLNLSENRVLAILVLNHNEVHNRIIEAERRYSPAELTEVANYLNQACAGRQLDAVRTRILGEMTMAREEMNRMMQAVVEMADKTFDAMKTGDDYVWAGQTNLMGIEAWADMAKLRQLFEAFNEKRVILHLLDQALTAEGVQIYIGEESGYEPLEDCSLVTSTYSADGRVIGVLGVIGPTRMPYERVIPIVDLTAKALGLALKSLH
jgi:heat-inducible transcriptional repressor